MTRELAELILNETAEWEPELPFKNAFECNFSVSIKVKFSPLRHDRHMIFGITIPSQLTESKSESFEVLKWTA
jgi:hypothetical protein